MKAKHKFAKILNDEQINDYGTVKEYLEFSFRHRLPEKSKKLYINICKIYDKYPKTIEKVLDNIPTLGYYKDYFHIMLFSRNRQMDNYIINIVVDQLDKDMRCIKEGKEISTLGKWLPRENCKMNKRTNFIDRFNYVFYPDVEDVNAARRKYRKMKSLINNKLGTLEAKMCTRQYDQINFNKVAHMALKRNTNALLKHDECKIKLEEFNDDKLRKMSLSEFAKELFGNVFSQEKLVDVWENNRFCMEIPYLNKMIQDAVCILDLSKDTFSWGSEYFAIGIALLIEQFSSNKTIIVCGNHLSYQNLCELKGDVIEKANTLMGSIGPCKEIDLVKYCDFLDKMNISGKNIVILSNKKVLNMESSNDKNVSVVQFINYQGDYDIIHFNGDKIRKFTKYNGLSREVDDDIINDIKDVKEIVTSSHELNDVQTPIYIVMSLLILFLIVKLKLYSFLYW